jgi:hypothetical protein
MNRPAFVLRTRIAPQQSTQIRMRDASTYAKNHAVNTIEVVCILRWPPRSLWFYVRSMAIADPQYLDSTELRYRYQGVHLSCRKTLIQSFEASFDGVFILHNFNPRCLPRSKRSCFKHSGRNISAGWRQPPDSRPLQVLHARRAAHRCSA